jgi:hypothetical protein
MLAASGRSSALLCGCDQPELCRKLSWAQITVWVKRRAQGGHGFGEGARSAAQQRHMFQSYLPFLAMWVAADKHPFLPRSTLDEASP